MQLKTQAASARSITVDVHLPVPPKLALNPMSPKVCIAYSEYETTLKPGLPRTSLPKPVTSTGGCRSKAEWRGFTSVWLFFFNPDLRSV